MNEKEFNLSEKQSILIIKVIDASAQNNYAEVGDLLSKIQNNEKEFIRLLREKIKKNEGHCFSGINPRHRFIGIIEKLAGENLI